VRIIQIVQESGRNGSGRVAFCLGEGLRAAGHDIIYAAHPGVLMFYNRPESDEHHWPIVRSRGLAAVHSWRAFNRRAATADLVVTHDSVARHFALGAKCLGLKPLVWFMRHCISSTSRFGPVQFYRLLVDHQIAVSDAIHRSLIGSGYPARRVTRIYGGADLRPFQSPDPAEVERRRKKFLDDLAPGTIVIGMVARMTVGKNWHVLHKEGKGYDVLFKALARVRFPYCVLVLGPHEPEAHAALRQMAAYYGAQPGNLRFAGFAADMTSYYPLMTLNVLPSRSEGLGLALIEGMAAGVASVGSRSGGIVEIIEHKQTGLLFEQDDDKQLAACLERLASDTRLRNDLARRGQASVLERFDASAMVQAFCELLARTHPAVAREGERPRGPWKK
jgi:glycosyltransferase involved in cell wall biosynthesis